MKIIENSVTERFLRYISYDTQSKEEGEQVPSTTKQLELGKLLTTELKEMGVANVRMDEHGPRRRRRAPAQRAKRLLL